MNLTWHITKKDLTRFRWPLAGLILVQVARLFIGAALRAGGGTDSAWFNRLQSNSLICLGLQALITYALVSVVVHEDAPTGTQVFWRTRPISGPRLLGSKLLTLALMFGVLPVLIDLPWWLACGFSPGEIACAAVDVMAWEAVVVVPALGLAVISSTFGRYFTLTIVAVGLVVFTALMRLAYFPGGEILTWNLLLSRLAVVLAFVVAGVGVVVVRQYRAHSVIPAHVTLGMIVIGVPLILGSWKHDFVGPWKGPVADSSADTRAISVAVTDANLVYVGNSDQPKLPRSLYVDLKADGLSPELAWVPQLAELAWTSRSGVLRTSDYSDALFGFPGASREIAVRRLLGTGERAADAETQHWLDVREEERKRQFPTVSEVRPRSVDEQRGRAELRFFLRELATLEPPTTRTRPSLTADFALGRPRLLVELPIAASDRVDRGSYSVRVANVQTFKAPSRQDGTPLEFEGRHVVLVESQRSGSMLDVFWSLLRLGAADSLRTDAWLLTRDRGDLVWCGPADRPSQLAFFEGVQITWRTATMQEPRVIRNGRWTSLWPDWERHVTLAFVAYDPAGQFRRTMPLGTVRETK